MNLWSKYKKTPECAAVIASLAAGYLTHNFALVNVMHNIDDIGNQPVGYGAGLPSGRWLLTLLGDFAGVLDGGINLPFLNGVLFLVLIALAAGFLVCTFRIRRRTSAVLMGILIAVFPTAATALLYRFTSVYYGLSFLLAVAAAWALYRYRYGILLSALLIALSLGIYQAYVSVTIGVFVLMLIQQALGGEWNVKTLVRRGLWDCLALVLGLLLYYLCLNICLRLYGTTLNTYQGMDTMGKLALGEIPALAWEAFRTFCKFPLTNYCGLAGSKLIKISYLLLGGVSVGMIGYLLIAKVKKIGLAVFTCLVCLAFPLAVNFVKIMAPEAWMYTMMVYAFSLVGCVPLILLECFPAAEKPARLTKAIAAVLVVLVLSYSYMTNVNDTANYYINRQVENYISSIVTQVRMTEGFTPEKKWALIGEINDPLLDSLWNYETSFGGIFHAERTLNDVSRPYWFWSYVGYRVPWADTETIWTLQNSEEVKAMPCWPSQGSVRVVEDIVVIKFQELSQ